MICDHMCLRRDPEMILNRWLRLGGGERSLESDVNYKRFLP